MANEDIVRLLIWYVAGLLRCCLVCSCHLVHVLVIGYLQHHQTTSADIAVFISVSNGIPTFTSAA